MRSSFTLPADQTFAPTIFVVRFWRETTAGEMRLRGEIEHVSSGENLAFLELDAILSFLRRFGIPKKDLCQRMQEEP